MKRLVILSMTALSCAVIANPVADQDVEKAAKKAAAKEKMLQITGGIVERAAQGKMLIVDGQSKISADEIKAQIENLSRATRCQVGYKKLDKCAEKSLNISDVKVPDGATLALYIVDDVNLPMSLIAPEAGWGIMNVRELMSGRRFKAEFIRTATLSFGAGLSQLKGSVMRPVRKAEDLDTIVSPDYKYDQVISLTKNLQWHGVTPSRKASFKRALEEGWAPAPSNDYQRAIWQQIHTPPTDPLRITFDPKTDTK